MASISCRSWIRGILRWLCISILFTSEFGRADVTEVMMTPEELQLLYRQVIPENKLGEGGCGVVYKVWIRDKIYALKLVSKFNDAALVRTAVNEITILHELREAPYIIHIYAALETDSSYWYVLDFASRGDLHDASIMARNYFDAVANPVLFERLGKVIAWQWMMSIAYVHAKGYTCRDIKTENVLVHGDGRVLMSDFGLAEKYVPYGGRVKKTAPGTIFTMPSETVNDPERNYIKRSDWYSMGVTLYEFFTGNNPYFDNAVGGWTERQVQYTTNLVSNRYKLELPKGFSKECHDFIEKLLQDVQNRLDDSTIFKHPWMRNIREERKKPNVWHMIYPPDTTVKPPKIEPPIGRRGRPRDFVNGVDPFEPDYESEPEDDDDDYVEGEDEDWDDDDDFF